jgi:predicted cobalt transporter CbtA
MRGLNKLFAAMIVGALFALPAGAIAQEDTGSAQGNYVRPGGVVQDQIQTQPAQAESDDQRTPPAATAAAPAQANDDGGELPFTGFDLALVVAAGGVLLLMGFGIRRFTRATEAV